VGIFSWILFGLLAGAVARLIVPGAQRIGCLATIAVGIVGALIGGALGEVLLDEEVDFGFDLVPFLLAVAGAVAFLLVLEAVRGRGRGPRSGP
jgi:uncharacterized membrane protein YeaQ/YmgE (transglycosylase-associated protein family)